MHALAAGELRRVVFTYCIGGSLLRAVERVDQRPTVATRSLLARRSPRSLQRGTHPPRRWAAASGAWACGRVCTAFCPYYFAPPGPATGGPRSCRCRISAHYHAPPVPPDALCSPIRRLAPAAVRFLSRRARRRVLGGARLDGRYRRRCDGACGLLLPARANCCCSVTLPYRPSEVFSFPAAVLRA